MSKAARNTNANDTSTSQVTRLDPSLHDSAPQPSPSNPIEFREAKNVKITDKNSIGVGEEGGAKRVPGKDRSKKPRRPRCGLEGCRKRLKITDTKCKCGIMFCGRHRCGVDHNCAKLHEKENADEFARRYGLGGGAFDKFDKL